MKKNKIFESFKEVYLNEQEFDKKDEKRILDIIQKSNGKYHAQRLAQTMANKITKADKALRRANAAADHNYHDIATIFYDRYEELDKTGMKRKIQLFDEDVAVRGDVAGQGEVIYPTGETAGSGDNFGTLGISYEKKEMVDFILQNTKQYTRAELESLPEVDVKRIYNEIKETK